MIQIRTEADKLYAVNSPIGTLFVQPLQLLAGFNTVKLAYYSTSLLSNVIISRMLI